MWDAAIWVSVTALCVHIGLLATEIVLMEEDSDV